MRSLGEIKKKVKWVKHFAGETFATEIETSRWKGSVIFGYNENGWEHVSVNPYNGKMPTWEEMCYVKEIFFNEEEEAIQIHPKKSEYVNMAECCLHLWRNTKFELPR